MIVLASKDVEYFFRSIMSTARIARESKPRLILLMSQFNSCSYVYVDIIL